MCRYDRFHVCCDRGVYDFWRGEGFSCVRRNISQFFEDFHEMIVQEKDGGVWVCTAYAQNSLCSQASYIDDQCIHKGEHGECTIACKDPK